MDDLISRQDAIEVLRNRWLKTRNYDGIGEDIAEECEIYLKTLPSAHPEQQRTFVELVVEYPEPELCTYKEYKGKPYYSIKYTENGETYVGYGTYNPKVLSRYLSEYFISSAQPEREKGEWIDGFMCSVCRKGYRSQPTIRGIPMFKYCPECGADMRGLE